MNHRFKFRAWDTFNERMVTDNEIYRFVEASVWDLKEADEDPRYAAPYRYYGDWQDDQDGIVRPCFIMQWTNILGKKKKEIYESDICKDCSGDLWVVKFIDGSFWFCNPRDARNRNTYDYLKGIGEWKRPYEVVGNIFQNPELI